MEHSVNKRLLVFFEGTANTLVPRTTLIGYFFQEAQAIDISDDRIPLPSMQLAFKMGFDGCGVTHGVAGTIWACGLATQCELVLARVHAILEHAGHLSITVLGLSRGGIAALMLAKVLASRGPMSSRVCLNLCLFDPVPGNLINTARYLDIFSQTVANSVIDVSECHITRVLAIYPHEPLPALAFHAPVIPHFPKNTKVELDATLGCHQGALYMPDKVPAEWKLACQLSMLAIATFFNDCGTLISGISESAAKHASVAMEAVVTDRSSPSIRSPSLRSAHHKDGVAVIARHTHGRFLNQMHKRLVTSLTPSDARLHSSSTTASKAHASDEPEFMLQVVLPSRTSA